MTTKTFEIRDSHTFIAAMAIKLDADNERDSYLLRRAGYGDPTDQYVLLTKLDGGITNYDPYGWGNRTMANAHVYIQREFDSLETGAVIDVEYILGETAQPKESEQITWG